MDVILGESEDEGMSYIDSMIFFGESTTAHLRSRGVLSGGRDTHQVWEDDSGTKTLSSKLLSETINYPPTGEKLTLAQALEKEKPAYIVLSFGLNGISGFINNKSSYVNNYSRLINTIQNASPNTRIILQSVYPVTANCDAWNESGAEICRYTTTLNQWLTEIAAAHENVRFVDTASVLTDANGCLDEIYDFNGDGIHLTTEAYERILHYLRTHAWKSN
jgi:lysophospholipase L1-like esterase